MTLVPEAEIDRLLTPIETCGFARVNGPVPGVLVHAMAGDMAARRGERGLLATDLFTYLPTCVNPTQRI